MSVERIENNLVLEKSRLLIATVYSLFEENKDDGFKNQLQVVADLIMNNINKGFEQKSKYAHIACLYEAEGSCLELRSILIDANEQKKIHLMDFQSLILHAMELSKMIVNHIKNCLTNKN